MPRLCVFAWQSADHIALISTISVKIKTGAFEGEVTIMGLEDPETGVLRDMDYFCEHGGVMWSVCDTRLRYVQVREGDQRGG